MLKLLCNFRINTNYQKNCKNYSLTVKGFIVKITALYTSSFSINTTKFKVYTVETEVNKAVSASPSLPEFFRNDSIHGNTNDELYRTTKNPRSKTL